MKRLYFDDFFVEDGRIKNDGGYISHTDETEKSLLLETLGITEIYLAEGCDFVATALNEYGLKCSKTIKKFRVSSANQNFTCVDGCICSKDEKILVKYPNGSDEKTVYIDDKIEEIGAFAFRGAKIENLFIGPNVKKLDLEL